MAQPRFVRIGRIAKAHGLRGEVCVDCHVDSPFLLRDAGRVMAGTGPDTLRPLAVRSLRMHKGRPMLTLDGVTDRNQAEALRGLDIYLEEGDLPEPGEDELYLYELTGCRVDVAGPPLSDTGEGAEGDESEEGDSDGGDDRGDDDEGGETVYADTPLGVIESIWTPTPDQEIWSIRTPDGREVLFPAEADFVAEVDLDAGRIVIDPPPGLLDIYLAAEPKQAVKKQPVRARTARRIKNKTQ